MPSPIIIGCMRLFSWGLDERGLRDWMHRVLDLGVTAFDHADCYGDYGVQAAFGAALEPGLRDRMEIIGKVGVMLPTPGNPGTSVKHYDLSRDHLIDGVERSLRDLRTDRLDWLLLHRPDYLLDTDEVAEAFRHLKASGKVLRFGVSNCTPSQMRLLAATLPVKLEANQVQVSLEHTAALADGTLDTCWELGLQPMAWSPLGGGGLFGTDPALDRLRTALWEVGQAHGGAAIDQVALAWLLRHPAGIRPIVGTGRLDRLAGAVGAASLRLGRQDWYKLLAAASGEDVP